MRIQAIRRSSIVIGFACLAVPPHAVSETRLENLTFQADARLRYEFVDEDRFDSPAEALTFRYRPSIEARPTDRVSVLVEAEAILALLPDERNGFFSNPTRPAIPDAENLELNRLQALFEIQDGWSVNLGRQIISLEDERFIGSVAFRQNQQTYDALTTSYTSQNGVTLNAGYIWQVNRFLGKRRADGTFDSDSIFIEGSVPTPIGQLGVFHFDLALDDSVQPDISSQTHGVKLTGRTFRGDLGVFWSASVAEQSSESANPTYVMGAVNFEHGEFGLGLRYEALGSDQGTSFQTPLATLHKFQGPADVFTRTPQDGLEDWQVSAVWRIGSIDSLRGTNLKAQFNQYDSAETPDRLGQEFGAQVSTLIGANRISLAATSYQAETFGADRQKVWLTIAHKF